MIPISSIISIFLIKKNDPSQINNDRIEKLDKNHISNNDNKKDPNYSKSFRAAIFNNRIRKLSALLIFSQFTMDLPMKHFEFMELYLHKYME